ncbi:MAG: hypothetical protein ACP5LQ_09265, partial [Candidatus Methanodesulfokora sp.]
KKLYKVSVVREMKNKNFVKEITQKRIKGLIEEFIGGRRKGITPNHIIGQIRSAIEHSILTIYECQKIVNDIRSEIETNKLFPTVSKDDKLMRLKILEDKLKEQHWWRK